MLKLAICFALLVLCCQGELTCLVHPCAQPQPCSDGKIWSDRYEGGTCICPVPLGQPPAGMYYDVVACKFVPICNDTFIWSDVYNACICNIKVDCTKAALLACEPDSCHSDSLDLMIDPLTCNCVKRCNESVTCSKGFKFNPHRCQCLPTSCPSNIPCPLGTEFNEDCICVHGTCCPSDHFTSSEEGIRTCIEGYHLDLTICECVPNICTLLACPPNFTLVNCSCVCEVACPCDLLFNATTCSCSCPCNLECGVGFRFDPATCTCVDPCVQTEECGEGAIFDHYSCSCQDPPLNCPLLAPLVGAFQSGPTPPFTGVGGFVSPCDPISEIFNVANCSCEPNHCLDNLQYNPFTGACTCIDTCQACTFQNPLTCACNLTSDPCATAPVCAPNEHRALDGTCACLVNTCLLDFGCAFEDIFGEFFTQDHISPIAQNPYTCQCLAAPSCPPRQYYWPPTQECVCNRSRSANTCVPGTTHVDPLSCLSCIPDDCPLNQFYVDIPGPLFNIFDFDTCVCDNILTCSGTLDTNNCTCNTGCHIGGGPISTVSAAHHCFGGYFNAEACNCTCPVPGTTYNSIDDVCALTTPCNPPAGGCPIGQYFDTNICQCAVSNCDTSTQILCGIAGLNVNRYNCSCSCHLLGQYYDYTTNTCKCIPTTCPPGFIQDLDLNRCGCVPANNCITPLVITPCVQPQVRNPATGRCTVLSQCNCAPCSGNFTLDLDDCACICKQLCGAGTLNSTTCSCNCTGAVPNCATYDSCCGCTACVSPFILSNGLCVIG